MNLILTGVGEAVVLAYIDPGTGSIVLQLLIGVLLGSVFAVKMFWRNLKNVILKLMGKQRDTSETESSVVDDPET